jgi:hypothetical protein
MQQTPNLNLNKPEGTDVVNIDDLNANADILDAKLGSSGHSHDGTAGNGPKITAVGLTDGAATDTVIGTRIITDTVTATSGSGLLTNLLSKIGYMIKNITGKSNWYTLPAITLETINNLFGISGHSHNGTAGQGPKIAYSNITGTPSSLPANGGTSAACSGNAATATKLATARTIALSGDVSGSASFNGSANATIAAVVADDSHNHVISNIDGLQAALNAKIGDAGYSFATNGCQKFSNGLIIQWGQGNSNSTTTFPITFPNECLSAVATPQSGEVDENLILNSLTTSGFYTSFGTHSWSMAFRYIAIGY